MQNAPQVASHLGALVQLLLLRSAAFPPDDFKATLQRLQAAFVRWSGAETPSSPTSPTSPSKEPKVPTKPRESNLPGELAAQSCECLVRALRLLNNSDLVWPSKIVCSACCFLALACALRAFRGARDVLVPGQVVTIFGLQSSAGTYLNGVKGQVQRFHAETGRFMVSLKNGDPPAEWKKFRPHNLQPDCPSPSASLAFQGAKECGRACLEAVAEIFDDLLLTMHEEDSDEVHIRVLHAQLASTMWEALVCCADREMLEASALLDLCSDDVTLCAVVARHVFSVHLTVHASSEGSDQSQTVNRLLAVQESFTKAYCRLYQPGALWGPNSETDGSIKELQASLQEHILRLAGAAVQMGVLPQLIDCCDFHLCWANAGIGPGICPVPLVLPVLLSRLVCTLATNGDSMVRRHILMLVPAFLAIADTFAELVIARLQAQAANSADLLTASQAVLDATIAAVGLGLQEESRESVEALALQFLQDSRITADAALLSRLALALLGASREAEPIRQGFAELTDTQKASFWQQARARCHLLNCSFEDVQGVLQDYCGAPQPLPPFENSAEVIPEGECSLGDPGEIFEVNGTNGEFPEPVSAMATVEEAMNLHHTQPVEDPAPPSLSALNLPTIPGQKAVKRKAVKRLGRNDISSLRGVDPAEAPEELRCAIDGKLLGAPVLSPYGHVFEEDTLKQWLTTCGSVCPITGKPLREEDCRADVTTQQKVLDWVKAARASYKIKKEEMQERRRLRQAEMAEQEDPV
ncbi:unnamed protein product [Cladocopium goreaui]|uniref:U-box domain-containing protein n=1 Tax=Cladocopium goreaui TaxID=2562237 RepID=A0A9P1BZT9_9DINO|nr:unnamed protein product [Cladocopium goreaui]